MNTPIKILVVDDEAGMRLTLKGILTRRGYEVTVASDGVQAIEAARKTEFRLVLMDIKMPGMSGVDAFVKIKEFNPHASVIMMTALASEDEISRALREGAFCVIHKPFEMDKVMTTIDECMTEQPVVLIVDDHMETRKTLREILKKKYTVAEAGSGEECLRKIAEKKFQIVILDIKLPGINGVETLKQIKEMRPGVGVIMMTGYQVDELIQQAVQHGSYTCLRKPIQVEQLIELIDRCLKGGKVGE